MQKIFIDSGDPAQVEKYLGCGICDGVTTNPTIMKAAGVRGAKAMVQRQIELAELIAPRPLSVEATSDIPEEIMAQALAFRDQLPGNIMVKVTACDHRGGGLLPVIYSLAQQGFSLNVTAMMTLNQCMLAAKALTNGTKDGSAEPTFPHAVSIFGGRISEEHGSIVAAGIIKNLRDWIDQHRVPVEIIAASIRSRENLTDWALTGAHILTVPPGVLASAMTAARSSETVAQFLRDAQEALTG